MYSLNITRRVQSDFELQTKLLNSKLNLFKSYSKNGLSADKTEVIAAPFFNHSEIKSGVANSVGTMVGVINANDDGVSSVYLGYQSGRFRPVGQKF